MRTGSLHRSSISASACPPAPCVRSPLRAPSRHLSSTDPRHRAISSRMQGRRPRKTNYWGLTACSNKLLHRRPPCRMQRKRPSAPRRGADGSPDAPHASVGSSTAVAPFLLNVCPHRASRVLRSPQLNALNCDSTALFADPSSSQRHVIYAFISTLRRRLN